MGERAVVRDARGGPLPARGAGADVVGMSTAPEVLAAREEGLNVAVLSLVTNKVVIPEYASVREEVEAEVRVWSYS